jgi:hypothetical protein
VVRQVTRGFQELVIREPSLGMSAEDAFAQLTTTRSISIERVNRLIRC